MHKLIARNETAFWEARRWLIDNGHSKNCTFEYSRATTGTRIILKVQEDAVAVMLKLVMGHCFL